MGRVDKSWVPIFPHRATCAPNRDLPLRKWTHRNDVVPEPHRHAAENGFQPTCVCIQISATLPSPISRKPIKDIIHEACDDKVGARLREEMILSFKILRRIVGFTKTGFWMTIEHADDIEAMWQRCHVGNQRIVSRPMNRATFWGVESAATFCIS